MRDLIAQRLIGVSIWMIGLLFYIPAPVLAVINPAPYRGVFIQNDSQVRTQYTRLDFISGVQNRFSWRQLQPGENSYNFGIIDNWLTKVKNTGKKAVIGVMIRCAADDNGGEACAPSWALTPKYQAIRTGNGVYLLNYAAKPVQDKLGLLINQLAARYGSDPGVAAVEIPVGYWGESNPHPGSNRIKSKQTELQAYKQAWGNAGPWLSYQNWLFRAYKQAFDGSQKPLMVFYTGSFLSHSERIQTVGWIDNYRLGLHHTGLQADFPLGASLRLNGQRVCAQDLPANNSQAYIGPWTPTERLSHKLPASFEFHHWLPRYEYNLTETEHIWWSLFNALDKGAGVVYAYIQNLQNPNTHPAWRFFDYYAKGGKNQTPAWIALKTYIGSIQTWCPDKGNFSWQINQNMSAAGGSTIGHYPSEPGYKDLPVRSKGDNDWLGAFSRQTDRSHNRPGLYFNLDDNFTNRHRGNDYLVEVIYYTGGRGDKQTKWRFVYDGASSPNQTGKVVGLTGTNQWRKAVFRLNQPMFNNRLKDKAGQAGNDFMIETLGPTEVYFSFIKLTPLNRSGDHHGPGQGVIPTDNYNPNPPNSTPTPTPTTTPTSNPLDVNGNQVPADRGDVICFISRYLKYGGRRLTGRGVLYDANQDGAFTKTDLIRSIAVYLRTRRSGSGRCADLPLP